MSSMIDRPGRYKAEITDWSLGETKGGPDGQGKIPVFTIEFLATEFQDGANWHDWTEYQATIRGYFFPFKKNTSPNETTINNLMRTLEWNGCSLNSLQEGNYVGRLVQIVVKEETYEGKTRLQVAWIDPGDFEGTLKKLDEQDVKVMAQNWDSKLRAINGGKGKGNGDSSGSGAKPKPAPKLPAASR